MTTFFTWLLLAYEQQVSSIEQVKIIPQKRFFSRFISAMILRKKNVVGDLTEVQGNNQNK
jgi:hypothetical protein